MGLALFALWGASTINELVARAPGEPISIAGQLFFSAGLPYFILILFIVWLKKKLDSPKGKYSSYKWGVVGVAEDKSSGVYVFLHNKNNTWAHGGVNA